MTDTTDYAGQPFDRQKFESLLKRRFFYTEAFEIYRTVSGFEGDNRGLFDYGPPGCGLMANIVDLWRKHFILEQVTAVESVREYTPNVIEPSFGIGRILYSLLEQVYWCRPHDAARGILSLPLSVAPTKVLLVPLSSHPSFTPIIKKLSRKLRTLGISNRVDNSSASIGKRYARNDELGTPFGITVDFETVKDGSVTLRERDSTKQVRASEKEVFAAVKNLVEGVERWEDVVGRLPVFTTPQEGDE
ncbi:hypothetical protein AJ79_03360 [Helicocarpus griseus UAMH5409]|uniref:Anticodon-binding domain-containing protein n=1 Tax=Helicocarpus griseus UAMH5409 TaxID=1447875 RepID=A0A2B7XYC4_9EURO|nr:hypothetical protein AJ79_03360 [Helicocarpus griseus UAMH5409]